MSQTIRLTPLALLAGLLAAALSVTAAPAPVTTSDTVKDRESFIPHRKYTPLPGKVVGLLVSDVAPKMAHEGRGGPPDAMGFSLGGGSYRWIYVPVEQNPLITGLQVKVGEKGERVQIYPKLSMANAQTIKQWNIQVPYALVEVEVNNGQGAPADEGFVATRMTRLDGTKDYPLDVSSVLAELRKRYATWKTDQARQLDAAMGEAQKKAIKERKATGPRETAELVYMTWLPESKKLRVHFRTTITDGEYKYSEGGIERDRFPLPPPPLPPGKVKGAPPEQPGVALPPPPPRFPRVRYGTSFGIEFGMGYEVNINGKVDRTLTLPVQSFSKELPPPPVRGIGGRPFELPPPRKD
jgi:hypothetical protein